MTFLSGSADFYDKSTDLELCAYSNSVKLNAIGGYVFGKRCMRKIKKLSDGDEVRLLSPEAGG